MFVAEFPQLGVSLEKLLINYFALSLISSADARPPDVDVVLNHILDEVGMRYPVFDTPNNLLSAEGLK